MSAVSSRLVTARAIHLCVDMQRLFAPQGPWPTPWLPRVAPVVARIVAHAPRRTIFTAFTPPREPEDMPGAWQRYYERWRHVTRAHLAPEMLTLVPELARFVPPAEIMTKTRYSAFAETDLAARLRSRGADSLIITGAETDVCVLATVLDAIDLGFPVVLVTDAVCSVSDEGHDSLVDLYQQRFSEQIEAIDSARLLRAWTPERGARG
jgi:nicotinamidase-related amidase